MFFADANDILEQVDEFTRGKLADTLIEAELHAGCDDAVDPGRIGAHERFGVDVEEGTAEELGDPVLHFGIRGHGRTRYTTER